MFLIKKLLGSLLMPLPMALLLLIVGYMLIHFGKGYEGIKNGKQRWGKSLMVAGGLVFLLSSNGWVARALVAPLEAQYESYQDRPISTVLVLGSLHHSAPNVPVTSVLEGDSLYRLVEGLRIALLHPQSTLVLSGYAFRDEISQAEAYKRVAVVLGFPEERIELITEGRDTYEEMLKMQEIVKSEAFALVTSAYHMPRSMASARKAGLNPVAAPTWHKIKPSASSAWSFIPSPSALSLSSRATHEYLGMAWYWLTGRI